MNRETIHEEELIGRYYGICLFKSDCTVKVESGEGGKWDEKVGGFLDARQEYRGARSLSAAYRKLRAFNRSRDVKEVRLRGWIRGGAIYPSGSVKNCSSKETTLDDE